MSKHFKKVKGYMHWTFVGVFDAYQTVLTINEEM